MTYTAIIRGKWLMDGAKTLSAAAAKLEEFANFLRDMEAAGLQLDGEIEDDYGVLYTGDAGLAERFDMYEDDTEDA